MNRVRQMIGWVSWLIVATHLYAFAWWSIDRPSYFVLPLAVYRWLDDLVGPTTQEATFDLELWSTAIAMVLGLHVISWAIFSCLKDWRRHGAVAWISWWRRVVAVVGWVCWLLVATLVLIICGEKIYRAPNGRLPNYEGNEPALLLGTFVVVGLVHVAVLIIARMTRTGFRLAAPTTRGD